MPYNAQMLWIVLALVAAVCVAAHDTVIKKLLDRNINPYLIGGSMFLISGILLAPIVWHQGIPEIKPAFYWAVFVTVALNTLATLVAYRALRMGDLSQIAPMSSFTPVFLIATSYFILGEVPTTIGFFGVILIVGGSYVLHRKSLSSSERWTDAWRRLATNRAGLLILSVAFIFSISVNFDKIAAVSASPLFSSLVVDTVLGLTLLAIMLVQKRGNFRGLKVPFVALLGIGAICALGIWASNTALVYENVSYVIAVKRTAILFSILAGYLFFHEENIRVRLLGGSIMVAGVIVIAFS